MIIKKEYSSFILHKKNPENHTCTLKLNISASESHRKLILGLIELYGNTELHTKRMVDLTEPSSSNLR